MTRPYSRFEEEQDADVDPAEGTGLVCLIVLCAVALFVAMVSHWAGLQSVWQ